MNTCSLKLTTHVTMFEPLKNPRIQAGRVEGPYNVEVKLRDFMGRATMTLRTLCLILQHLYTLLKIKSEDPSIVVVNTKSPHKTLYRILNDICDMAENVRNAPGHKELFEFLFCYHKFVVRTIKLADIIFIWNMVTTVDQINKRIPLCNKHLHTLNDYRWAFHHKFSGYLKFIHENKPRLIRCKLSRVAVDVDDIRLLADFAAKN